MAEFEHGFLEALFDSADIGLGLIDTDFRYVRVNETLAKINGRAAAEHEGLTVRDVLPEFADLIEELLGEVMRSQEPLIDFEVSGPTPGDPLADRHFLATYAPICQGDTVIGVGALVIEVTDRVRGEKRLTEQAHQVYEGVVQDLTVAQLGLEQGDPAVAAEAINRALDAAKGIASRVLVEKFIGND